MVDRITNENRIQLRELNDDWDEKIRHLEQRIKGTMMEKSSMEKEVIRLANKLSNATKKYDEEYVTVRENLRNEEKSRADHTSRILETRIIGLTEGAEMA